VNGIAWWAGAAVRLAARLQPTAQDRARYRSEFLAELHGLPRADQGRYAAGVLATAPALRAALQDDGGRIDEGKAPMSFWRRLSCRLGFHRWKVQSTEDGSRYVECTACGKDKPPPGLWADLQ
jgi:hypothetical protein